MDLYLEQNYFTTLLEKKINETEIMRIWVCCSKSNYVIHQGEDFENGWFLLKKELCKK